MISEMIIVIKLGHDNYIDTCIFYSIINFGSNHCGSSLHLNIMNVVSSAILDMDTVSSFTCHFDGFISSDFRIVVILILLDSDT